MLIYEHKGGSVTRYWPRDDKYKEYDANEDNDYIVETTVTGTIFPIRID